MVDWTVVIASAVTGGVALAAAWLASRSAKQSETLRLDAAEQARLRDLRLEAVVEFQQKAIQWRDLVHDVSTWSVDPVPDSLWNANQALQRELAEAGSMLVLICTPEILDAYLDFYSPVESNLRRLVRDFEMGVIDADEIKEPTIEYSHVLGRMLAKFRSEVA